MSGKHDEGPARTFRLFDLRVEIVAVEPGLEEICNHHLGDCFELSGENLTIPAGKSFSIYALAAVLPLLPAKQRVTDANDWMTSDDLVMCPDPNCRAMMRITRTGVREFRRDQVTVTPLPEAAPHEAAPHEAAPHEAAPHEAVPNKTGSDEEPG